MKSGTQQNNVSIHSLKKIRDTKYFQDQRGYETDYMKRKRRCENMTNGQKKQKNKRFAEELNSYFKGGAMTDANPVDYASEVENKIKSLEAKYLANSSVFRQMSHCNSELFKINSNNASAKSTQEPSSNQKLNGKPQNTPLTISKTPYQSLSFQSKQSKGVGKSEGKWNREMDIMQEEAVFAKILESSFEDGRQNEEVQNGKNGIYQHNQVSVEEDMLDIDESESESKSSKIRQNNFQQPINQFHLSPHRQIYLSPQISSANRYQKYNNNCVLKNNLNLSTKSPKTSSLDTRKLSGNINDQSNQSIHYQMKQNNLNTSRNMDNECNQNNNAFPAKRSDSKQSDKNSNLPMGGGSMKQIIGIRAMKRDNQVSNSTKNQIQNANSSKAANNIPMTQNQEWNGVPKQSEDKVKKIEEFYQTQVERQQQLVIQQQRQIALYQQQLQQQTLEFQLFLQEQQLLRQTQLLSQQQQNQLLVSQQLFSQNSHHSSQQQILQNQQQYQQPPTPIVINNNISKDNFSDSQNVNPLMFSQHQLLSPQQQFLFLQQQQQMQQQQQQQQQLQPQQQQQQTFQQQQQQQIPFSNIINQQPQIGVISQQYPQQQIQMTPNQMQVPFFSQAQQNALIKTDPNSQFSFSQAPQPNRSIYVYNNNCTSGLENSQQGFQEQSQQEQMTTCSNTNDKIAYSQQQHQQSFVSLGSVRGGSNQRKKWDIGQKSDTQSEISIDDDFLSFQKPKEQVKKPAVKFEIFWEKDEIEQELKEKKEKEREKEKEKELAAKSQPEGDQQMRKSLQDMFIAKKNELQKRLENEKATQQQVISCRNQSPDISKGDLLQIRKDLLKPKSHHQSQQHIGNSNNYSYMAQNDPNRKSSQFSSFNVQLGQQNTQNTSQYNSTQAYNSNNTHSNSQQNTQPLLQNHSFQQGKQANGNFNSQSKTHQNNYDPQTQNQAQFSFNNNNSSIVNGQLLPSEVFAKGNITSPQNQNISSFNGQQLNQNYNNSQVAAAGASRSLQYADNFSGLNINSAQSPYQKAQTHYQPSQISQQQNSQPSSQSFQQFNNSSISLNPCPPPQLPFEDKMKQPQDAIKTGK